MEYIFKFIALTVAFWDHLSVLLLVNPRAYKGEWKMSPPLRFFLNFSKANPYPDLPFSVAVCLSLRHILKQVLVRIGCYGYEI